MSRMEERAHPPTHLHLLTFMSGASRIFLVSHATFISSLVYPLGWKTSMCGMML